MSAQLERRRGIDRRQERHFRFHNRRGGFDRRRAYPFLRTLRDAPWTLFVVLALINVLSAVDGLLTTAELATGLAREGNPVFGHMIRVSPYFAGVFKVVVMLAVSVGIWRGRRYRSILMIAPITAGLYAALLAYHLGSLSGLGFL